jgi:hypothetical protein
MNPFHHAQIPGVRCWMEWDSITVPDSQHYPLDDSILL